MVKAIRLKNFLSSSFFLSAAYIFYAKSPYYKNYFGDKFIFPFLKESITLQDVFKLTFIAYAACLFLIYFLMKNPKEGKGLHAIRALKKIFLSPLISFEQGIPKEEKTGILAVALKIFFTPLMISWLLGNSSRFIHEAIMVFQNWRLFISNFTLIFQEHAFLMMFNLILLVDVFFFGVGYLIELPLFKNTILSVEQTLIGWAAALVCYPPFNSYAINAISWKSTDFPYFSNNYLFLSVNIAILLLMAVYSWASVSLGFKASNLTHRGIVSKGPYRFIRHPAYLCKNLAWWLGGLPFMANAIKEGITPFLLVLLSLASWSYVYLIRAVTEERHLKSVNSEYEEYMKKVPYRFVPFLV